MRPYLRVAGKFIEDNSSALLSAVAIAGTLTTAILTGRAAVRASEILDDYRELGREPDNQDIFVLVWRLYVPPVTVCTLTVISIIGANRIGTRRAAAMAAAYSLSEKAFVEYQEKVIEHIGRTKEGSIRDSIVKDRVTADPPSQNEVIIAGGDILCYEKYTGRYFKSDVESLRRAQNTINSRLLHEGYISLTDFYNEVGLPTTSCSDEVGWKNDTLLDIIFTTVLSDDGRPCVAIDYRVEPIRNYYRMG